MSMSGGCWWWGGITISMTGEVVDGEEVSQCPWRVRLLVERRYHNIHNEWRLLIVRRYHNIHDEWRLLMVRRYLNNHGEWGCWWWGGITISMTSEVVDGEEVSQCQWRVRLLMVRRYHNIHDEWGCWWWGGIKIFMTSGGCWWWGDIIISMTSEVVYGEEISQYPWWVRLLMVRYHNIHDEWRLFMVRRYHNIHDEWGCWWWGGITISMTSEVVDGEEVLQYSWQVEVVDGEEILQYPWRVEVVDWWGDITISMTSGGRWWLFAITIPKTIK